MNTVHQLIWKYSWRNQTYNVIYVLDQNVYDVEDIKTSSSEMESTVVLGKNKAFFETWH